MIIGAILQTASFGYAQMIVARVVTGLGNGLNVRTFPLSINVYPDVLTTPQTSTVPAYHAECSPAAHRGSLIMIEGSLITFGIMISYVSIDPISF
jgi:MFS family permease